MAASSSILIFISILLFICFSSSVNALPGGVTEIKDVKTNKEVQDLGKYAVDEQTLSKQLTFEEVVQAQSQVVAGMKYYLKISATEEDGKPKLYDAVVVVQAWKKPSNSLISFDPSN